MNITKFNELPPEEQAAWADWMVMNHTLEQIQQDQLDEIERIEKLEYTKGKNKS